MAYDPNDPNQDSQQDVNRQYDAGAQQLISLNQLLRQDPSYTQWMQTHGGGVRDLNDQEKSDLMTYVRTHYGVPDDTEIDDNGRVAPTDTSAQNWWRIAAVAAVPLAVYGAAALAGAGAGAAGVGAAPALGSGATLVADLGGAGALSAGGAGLAAGAGASIPAAGSFAGDFAGTGTGIATGSGAGASTASILSRIGQAAGAAGQGIGAATDQAAQNRMAQDDHYVGRAELDDKERKQALHDIYVANAQMNPTNSPFDPRPRQAPTGDLAAALAAVSSQDTERLKKPGTYNATNLPSLAPSTLEQVGDWVSPALSVLSTIGRYYR